MVRPPPLCREERPRRPGSAAALLVRRRPEAASPRRNPRPSALAEAALGPFAAARSARWRDGQPLDFVALDQPRNHATGLRLFDEGAQKGRSRGVRPRRADRLLDGAE